MITRSGRRRVGPYLIIGLGNDSAVEAIVNQMLTDYPTHPYLANALSLIAEEYYTKGLESRAKGRDDQALERMDMAVAILEQVLVNFPEFENEIYIYYMLGLSLDELGDYLSASEAYKIAIEIDFNQPGGGNIQWCWLRVADCFEKMKAEDRINGTEADIEIEAAYQNVVIRCPFGKNFQRALVRLGEINLAKHKYATACAYFQQFLAGADSNDPSIADINSIVEKYRRWYDKS